MSKIDIIYHQLSKSIIETGYEYFTDNRDEPCVQISSANIEIGLDTFPLLTTKKMFTKGIVEELLWFLRGDSDIYPLVSKDVHIWDKDAYNHFLKSKPLINTDYNTPFDKDNLEHFKHFIGCIQMGGGQIKGDVGRNYGVQWRNWTSGFAGSIDQIVNLIKNLQKPNPINRRHIVTAWNPAELDETALPPCHWAFEIIVRPMSMSQRIQYSGKDEVYLNSLWNAGFGKSSEQATEAKQLLEEELSHVPKYGFILKWHQRSVDTFLGLPFNIASYALLAYIIGSVVEIQPLSIIGDLSNVHFYKPHIPAIEEQLSNNPNAFDGCTLSFSENYLSLLNQFKANEINFDTFIAGLSHQDFTFNNYQSFRAIKAEMFEPKQ